MTTVKGACVDCQRRDADLVAYTENDVTGRLAVCTRCFAKYPADVQTLALSLLIEVVLDKDRQARGVSWLTDTLRRNSQDEQAES